jgi:ATPase, P-type (transporting), HAD superfamily, subfamily IC
LTYGKPEVTDYYFSETVNEDKLLDIVVALESESNHPLADAILRKFKAKNNLSIEVTNQIGKGLMGEYKGKNYRIGKPTSFEQVSKEFIQLNNKWSSEGKTVIYIAEEEVVLGLIALMDVPHDQAKATIDYFKKNGIHTTLITGDSEMTGKAVAKQLGIDEVVANVMPEDKAKILTNKKKVWDKCDGR